MILVNPGLYFLRTGVRTPWDSRFIERLMNGLHLYPHNFPNNRSARSRNSDPSGISSSNSRHFFLSPCLR